MAGALLSVVVPTYCGRDSIEPLLARLRATLDGRGLPFEVVVVNDASPDDTWSVLQKLSREYPELHAIDLLNNHGQPMATMCGIYHARGTLVATLDDDLQHPPEELAKLLDALDEHPDWDVVVGAWERDEGWFRDLGSWVFQLADRVAHGTPKGFRHSGFRVMRRPAARALIEHETRMPSIGPLLKQIARNVHNVPVEHHERPYGRSGFQIGEGVYRVISHFLHGTALPLRLLSRFGLLCAGLAVALGLYFFSRWLLGYQTLMGWASSFLAIVFFGGSALFGIGILGEYTHLLIREVRRPPRWNIREDLPRDDAP